MTITALNNILTSLHGNRAGLDKDGNFITKGLKVQRNATTDQQFIHNDVETATSDSTLSPGGHSIIGATAAASYNLSTAAAIGQRKTIRNASATTLIMTVYTGATSIAFSASTTLQRLNFILADAAVSLVRESAARWSITSAYTTGSITITT